MTRGVVFDQFIQIGLINYGELGDGRSASAEGRAGGALAGPHFAARKPLEICYGDIKQLPMSGEIHRVKERTF